MKFAKFNTHKIKWEYGKPNLFSTLKEFFLSWWVEGGVWKPIDHEWEKHLGFLQNTIATNFVILVDG